MSSDASQSPPDHPNFLPEQRFFDDPITDRLLAFSMTLASEVYVLRERLSRLEQHVATLTGDATLVEAPPVSQSEDAVKFVGHLLEPLLGEQQSRGYP